MIIDTHCHYNLPPLVDDATGTWKDHWQKAQAAGVTHSIVIGIDYESSQQALGLAKEEAHFAVAIGFHPHAVTKELAEQPDSATQITEWIQKLQELLAEKTNIDHIVAIGETGLDYYQFTETYATATAEKSLQQTVFIEHIKLADAYNLPLIIHVRDTGEQAYLDTLSLLKAHKRSSLPFILHCISGPLHYIAKAIELGAYIGIAGNATYKNAEHIRDIIRSVPSDRLLLETDAPFLPPIPHRGQICEPWMIQLTADYIKENLGCSLEQIYSNTVQVFPRLNKP